MITDEKMAELRAEHGDVYVIGEDEHAIVVRMPKPAEFERFTATAGESGAKALRATGQLVRDVLLYPSRADYDAMVQRRPGLPLAYGKAIADLTGATLELKAREA